MSQRTDLFHAWEATQKALGYSQAVRAGDTVRRRHRQPRRRVQRARSGDLPAQMRNIYRRIGETLAQFSLGFGHVVRETMVVTDMDALMPALAYRKSIYGDGPFPASTTVEVKRLFAPGLMIEIEVTASVASSEG